jgi:hypothetical protein
VVPRRTRRGGLMDAKDPRHGTANGYTNLGCRCDPCRTARRLYRNSLMIGPRNKVGGLPKSGPASYSAIHARIHVLYGPARIYDCVDCGDNAHEWSYDGKDLNATCAVTDVGHTLIYSQNLDHYQPVCRPCHARRDHHRRPRKFTRTFD